MAQIPECGCTVELPTNMAGQIDQAKLEEIVRRVLAEMNYTPAQRNSNSASGGVSGGQDGIFADLDSAVAAARRGLQQLEASPLELRRRAIEAARAIAVQNARTLAEMAREETGLGRVDCKTNKNLLAATKTPGTEILEPVAMSGDHGLTVIERAPFGVVASIIPTTNPTASVINNAISIVSAGNTVVFNAHPRSKRCANTTIQMLNCAIQAATGLTNLLTAIAEPSVESAQSLMNHSDVNLLVVTGGPGVAKYAMQTGKRAICAGPGNPPVVVDESADIAKAGRDIVAGCSFDNNLPCTTEKEIFVVAQAADELKAAMVNSGAYELRGEQIRQLERVIFREMGAPFKPGVINMDYLGQDAAKIAAQIGLKLDDSVRVLLMEVPAEHSLVWTEQMIPVLPLVRVRNADEAIDMAKRAEHGFHHSAVMHSMNLHNLSRMAREINTAIFTKNGPNFAGLGFNAEGYTSFSIGTKTGEGMTTARTFSWERRCVLVDHFRIV